MDNKPITNMIIFLYGPDTYRSQQKLNEIIENYKKIRKTGLNFFTIDFKESDFDNFKQIIESHSIFGGGRLVILKDLFSSEENKIKKIFEYLEKNKPFASKEEIIIVYEKNLPYGEFKEVQKNLFDKLKKYATSQEFEFLNERGLASWIKKELSNANLKISQGALEKLIFYVGNDLWRMSNEIKKLILFDEGKEKVVEEKDIDLLVKPKIDTNIFKTIDAIAGKNKKLAIRLINEHIEEGESEGYILSMILWQIRNLVGVKSCESGREFNANYTNMQIVNKVSKKLKLHPYVAEKTLKESLKFTLEELKKIYQKILEVDYKIKTGKIRPKTALNLFIAEV